MSTRYETTEVRFPTWKMKAFLSAVLVIQCWVVSKMYAILQGAYEAKLAAMQLDENVQNNAIAHAWASADLGSMLITFTGILLLIVWSRFIYEVFRYSQAKGNDATPQS